MKNIYLKILTYILKFTIYKVTKRVISVLSRNCVHVKMLQLCIFVAYSLERKHEKQNGANAKYVKCH